MSINRFNLFVTDIIKQEGLTCPKEAEGEYLLPLIYSGSCYNCPHVYTDCKYQTLHKSLSSRVLWDTEYSIVFLWVIHIYMHKQLSHVGSYITHMHYITRLGSRVLRDTGVFLFLSRHYMSMMGILIITNFTWTHNIVYYFQIVNNW